MIWVSSTKARRPARTNSPIRVNNGPWGEALTDELIPWLERHYRMDGRASRPFPHRPFSSGGWATLWLQTRYPAIFGGTWSTSPDPSDFHDFTGVDLYAPDANAYRRADGTPTRWSAITAARSPRSSNSRSWRRVLGAYGGQFASFDWVFSPKGPDGRPLQMFDRATGAVNPAIVRLLARPLRHRLSAGARLAAAEARSRRQDPHHRRHRRHLLSRRRRPPASGGARPARRPVELHLHPRPHPFRPVPAGRRHDAA